jgi:hypothetical protein
MRHRQAGFVADGSSLVPKRARMAAWFASSASSCTCRSASSSSRSTWDASPSGKNEGSPYRCRLRISPAAPICVRTVRSHLRLAAVHLLTALRVRVSRLPEAARVCSEAERFGFITWIAADPDAGNVIPGADGTRKIRWKLEGTGKSGGTHLIYFNLTDEEIVLLMAVYATAERENMLPKDIRKVA